MSQSMVKRPPSEDLIDLHVFVVPIESWLGKYSVAYNNVALQSTSAGFIRVYPHATLQIVRELIEDQLDTEVVPTDYVFLRSVGRCLAVVNQNQEKTLKAKYFLPPVAFSPEIFMLPGTHELIAALRKQTKSIVVNGNIAVEDDYRLKSNEYYEREISEDYPRSEQYSEDGDINANRQISQDQTRQHAVVEEFSLDVGKGNQTLEDAYDEGEDPSEMLLEDAHSRKSRHNFSDVIKAKQRATEKKNALNHKREQRYTKGVGDTYGEVKIKENRSKVDESLRSEVGRRGEATEKKGKENSGQGHSNSREAKQSPRRARSDGGTPKHEKAMEREGIAPALEQQESGKRQRSETFPRGGPAIQVLHPEIIHNPSSPFGMNRPSPIPSANVIHSTLSYENVGRASEEKFAKSREIDSSRETKVEEKKEDDNSEENGSFPAEKVVVEIEPDSGISEDDMNEKGNKLQMNNRYGKEGNSPSTRIPNPEDLKRKEEERRRLEEEKAKMEEMKKNMENDTLQMMKEMEDLLRKKKEEDEKRKEEEERRKREEKERIESKKNEASQLRDQLIKIREARIEKQKQREGLMKNARELKAKVSAKRGSEISLWEKKYRVEKERAVILEEEIMNLKSELGASQKKLLKSLEQKDPDEPPEQKSPRTIAGPSQSNNLKNEVRKLNKEKERMESDIEKTKRKLVIESQQKAAAHQELKELRNDKKVTVTAAKTDKAANTRTKLSNLDT